ncbi:MAG: hypothetical protein SPJ13_06560 [Bacteroidales bacterium]|nr:hypothetical protein [Bacteroidales bacterium]
MQNRCLAWFFAMAMPLCGAAQRTLSPLEFGLDTASSGESRYMALYHAHLAATRQHLFLDYSHVGDIDLDIPADAQPIPLTDSCDFHGITITVSNHTKDITLFALQGNAVETVVPQSLIDEGDFRSQPSLANGRHLLLIKDQKPWTQRQGFGYYHYRHDILSVVDGIAENHVIMPYSDTTTSKASCLAVHVDGKRRTVSNVTLRRKENATFKTYFINVSRMSNVLLENITLVTPNDPKKYSDAALSINNCVHVTVRNLLVDGSYSQTDQYGYGISLNNVWDVHFEHVVGRNCSWGVFGANNLSDVTLEDCDLNRFDIHCYGRNVTLRRCLFSDQRVQYSSVFGTILYDSCTFRRCVPLYIRPSYNAQVPFDVVMRRCTFETSSIRGRVNLFDMGALHPETNPRPELSQKCWPNVTIQDLTIRLGFGVRRVYLFRIEGGPRDTAPLAYCDHITLDGLHFESPIKELKLCNRGGIAFINKPTLAISRADGVRIINNLFQ